MKTYLIFLFAICSSFSLFAQRFDLGNSLNPKQPDFEYLGTSSATGVSTYKYKKPKTDKFFNRNIGDIIVGVRSGKIVTTIYNLIPDKNDIGVPSDIIQLVQANLPYPLKDVNGVYGVNIDNESISIARVRNPLTFNQDRIMILNTVKQSILENTK